MENTLRRAMPVLTLQQLRVLLQLAGGRSYKQAAFALELGVDTVRLHVWRISLRLPGDGPPKQKVLLHADRLIAAQPLDMLVRAKAA